MEDSLEEDASVAAVEGPGITSSTRGPRLPIDVKVFRDVLLNIYIADTGNNRVIKIAQSVSNHPTGNNGGSRMRR